MIRTARWLTRGLTLLAAGMWTAAAVQAQFVEAGDIQARKGDASPTASESKINNYLFQDEQINISPTDGVVRVLRTDQKVLINDYVTAVFPLRYANPRELRNVLRQVTAMEGGWAEIVRDLQTNENFVQVIAPKYMIPHLRQTVEALDVQWLREYDTGSVDVYAKLKNRGDPALVDLIASNYAGSEGFSTVDVTNNALRRLDEPYRAEAYAKAVEMLDIPANEVLLEVTVYEIAGRNDTQLGLDYISWKNGPGRNLFVFAAGGYNAVSRGKGWTSVFDPFVPARSPVGSGGLQNVLETTARESYSAVNYLLPSNFMDFLNAKGKARVINRQQVLVKSAEPALLVSSQQVLAISATPASPSPSPTPTPNGDEWDWGDYPAVMVRSSAQGYYVDLNNNQVKDAIEPLLTQIGSDPRGFGNVALQDYDRRLHYTNAGTVGMRIVAVPYVGTQSMELEIEACFSEVNGLAANGLPIINERKVESTVRLLDGQPYVIAGLTRKTNTQRAAKAPWLGSIPILGYLAGGETNLKRDTDLVITVTPHFYISSQAKIARPPRLDTLQMIIDGTAPLGLPANQFGYDMYDWWPFNNEG